MCLSLQPILRGVCSTWLNVLEEHVRSAIDGLMRLYPGRMQTFIGHGRQYHTCVYSTLFTCLQEALRDGCDPVRIRIITTWSGYLPIPWDLLAYNVLVGEQYHRILSLRWGVYGDALHEVLTTGFNIKSRLPIYAFERLSMSAEKIKMGDYIHSLNYEELIQYLAGMVKEYGGNSPHEDMKNILYAANFFYMKSMEIVLPVYAFTPDWATKPADFITRHYVGDIGVFPYPCHTMSMEAAFSLDRPDILHHILTHCYFEPSSRKMKAGTRVTEYMNARERQREKIKFAPIN